MHNQGTKGVGGQHQAPSAYLWEGDPVPIVQESNIGK